MVMRLESGFVENCVFCYFLHLNMDEVSNSQDGSDGELQFLLDRVASKLGWTSETNLNDVFQELSLSTKKKKKKDVSSRKHRKPTSKSVSKNPNKNHGREAANASGRKVNKSKSVDICSGSSSETCTLDSAPKVKLFSENSDVQGTTSEDPVGSPITEHVEVVENGSRKIEYPSCEETRFEENRSDSEEVIDPVSTLCMDEPSVGYPVVPKCKSVGKISAPSDDGVNRSRSSNGYSSEDDGIPEETTSVLKFNKLDYDNIDDNDTINVDERQTHGVNTESDLTRSNTDVTNHDTNQPVISSRGHDKVNVDFPQSKRDHDDECVQHSNGSSEIKYIDTETPKHRIETNDRSQRRSFSESPEPMRWLMTSPHKKSSGLTTSAEKDPSPGCDDDDHVFGGKVLSLTERLARNHQRRKESEKKSTKKNRRRSCANPRSAPLLLDRDWDNDDNNDLKEDEEYESEERCGKMADVECGKEDGTGDDEADDVLKEPLIPNSNRSIQKESRSSDTTIKPNERSRKHDPSSYRVKEQDTSSDDDFETFLDAIKTPQHSRQSSKPVDTSDCVFVVDDDDDFIDDTPLKDESDDDLFYLKVNNLDNPITSKKQTDDKKIPTSRSGSVLSQVITLFDDDDDEDDDNEVFEISKYYTPSLKKKSTTKTKASTTTKITLAKPRRPLRPASVPASAVNCATPSRRDEARPASCSFLASLSTPGKGMPTRSRYVSDFKRNKDELTQKLFRLYNDTVFENKLPSDFSITWNNRMRKTAGFCFYKKKMGDVRTARVELSVKVCDTAERLRDTLIHELCHAAAWLIHGVSDGHGKFWKYWAAKANLAHPELPIIKRCHTYEINTKFKYKCVQCGNIIGRHSKSVDTSRFCCAYCHGKLELMPALNKDGTPAKTRGPNRFAVFVKENYASVKKGNATAKHADVMRLLSQEFANKAKIAE